MGKYAKYALVLLYVAQLVIAFREQLVHLYKHAVETVHREAALSDEVRRVSIVSIKRAMKPLADLGGVLYAAPGVLGLATVGPDHEEPHFHDHREDDKYKERQRRSKKTSYREFLLLNLYPLIRIRRVPPSASEARERDVERADLFPEAMYAS